MIYCDMDGVLVDLAAGAELRGIMLCDQAKERHHMTAAEVEHDDRLRVIMNEPGFFEGLPPMPDVMELWKFILPFGPAVLTARPKSDIAAKQTAGEKLHWLARELHWVPPAGRFICCLRSEKAAYVCHLPGEPQILIDDRLSNCVAWNKAGGYSILHTSAADTVMRLRTMIADLAPHVPLPAMA